VLAKRFETRFDVLIIIAVIVFTALISRLGFLQVVQGKFYQKLADGNRIRLIPIMAPRGTFYDRHGVPMVSNRPGFSVALVPLDEPIDNTVVDKLAGILGMDPIEIQEKIKKKNGSFEPIIIKNDLGPEMVTKIVERHGELPGVVIHVQAIRNYLNKELAAHAFGYVGEISKDQLAKRKDKGYKAGDIIGKDGLEWVYDSNIRGTDGGEQVEVDVQGRPVQVLGKKESVPGDNLILTLDSRIQKAAEQALDEQLKFIREKTPQKNAYAAAVVAVNPKTGEILAMASRPNFDPNWFAGGGIAERYWKMIAENKYNPLNDRVIAGQYAPGSLYKIVTGAAALELGKVTPYEEIFCGGHHRIYDAWCWEKTGHGKENFVGALADSCDIYFYELGLRLGIDNMEDYSRQWGLGKPTGINLPGEAEGLVPSRAWKLKNYNEKWYEIENIHVAIGQGFHLYTPLQMANVISAVANGGKLYKPQLVSQIVAPDGTVKQQFGVEEIGQVSMNTMTLNLLREGLRKVATDGTAGGVFDGFPVSVAGKTGTAENPPYDDFALFAGYAPFDDPTIAVVVVVEQGGHGGSAAAPIARKVMEAAFMINQPSLLENPTVLNAGSVL
jgi:penicillin-binding protein 2